MSLGSALPFALVFGAAVGPHFWQLTLTPTSRLFKLCMGLRSALTKPRCPCTVDQHWAMLQMGETRCRCLGRAVTGNLYNSGATQQWLCASPVQTVFVLAWE